MNVVTVVLICLAVLSVTMVLDGFTVKNGISRWLAGLTLAACAACTATGSAAVGMSFRTGGMTALVLLSFVWLNVRYLREAMLLRYAATAVFSFFLFFVSVLTMDFRWDGLMSAIMIALGAAYCAILSTGPADAFFLALFCIVFTDAAEGVWGIIADGYVYFDVGSALRAAQACVCALVAFVIRHTARRINRARAARRMGVITP